MLKYIKGINTEILVYLLMSLLVAVQKKVWPAKCLKNTYETILVQTMNGRHPVTY